MPLWIYLFLDTVGNIVPELKENGNKILLYHLKINGTYLIQQYKSLDLAKWRYSWKYLHYKILSNLINFHKYTLLSSILQQFPVRLRRSLYTSKTTCFQKTKYHNSDFHPTLLRQSFHYLNWELAIKLNM